MPAGIFCIENWSNRLASHETVKPILDLLEAEGHARVVHQRVSTSRELGHYLAWFAGLDTYEIAYLAMHGDKGAVYVGSEQVKLQTLTAWSTFDEAPRLDGYGRPTEWAVNLKGKVLYLGSCSSLRVTPSLLREFKEETGVRAICGYTKPVDWMETAGFEIILLSALADAMDSPDPQRQLRANVRRLQHRCGSLLETLGFTCWPDW